MTQAIDRWDRRGVSRRGPKVIAGGAGLTLPDALLNAEATYWADDGPVLDGSGNIEAWANLGSAGSALDLTQGTAGARLIHLASDPDFDGRASAEGDTNRWMPGVVSTIFDLADGDSLDLLVFGLIDVANAVDSLASTRNGSGAGVWMTTESTNNRFRCQVFSGVGNATGFSAASSITAATLFAARGRYVGAASPTNDVTDALVDGVAGVAGSNDLGAIAPGLSVGIASARSSSLVDGFDGKLSLVSGKVGVWSGAELTEIATFIQSTYPSWGGAAV